MAIKNTSAKTGKKVTPRIAAAVVLAQLLKQQGSLASLLPQQLSSFSTQEQSFIKELCYGCCRWYPLLEQILKQLLKQPLKQKDADIKAILLLGLYQLQFLRTPEHAAINESVNAVSFFKKIWAKKLVNAVLRGYQREQQTLFDKAQAQTASVHPLWLEKEIVSAWPEYASAIFSANNQHPPLTLRVNCQQSSRDDYLQKLEEKAIVASVTPYSDVGIYLNVPVSVNELPAFDQGAASVQDEAAQLSAGLLDLKPGLRVLDACCAPGGKTCHIGEKEARLSELIGVDIEERRLGKVRDNLKRLNITADIICGDAAQPDKWWDGKLFDRILLDAPCSATGIIRRQPDIKLLRQPEHIEALTTLQLSLLQALWPLLADGGILLYATCSILPQENTQIVQRFVESRSDVLHEPIFSEDGFDNNDIQWGILQPFGRQLLPINGLNEAQPDTEKQAENNKGKSHDGFFYARLRKIKEGLADNNKA